MKKLKLTIVFMSILLVSIFVSSSFDLFESIAVETELENVTEESTDLVGASGVPEKKVIKEFEKVSVEYDKITSFPINSGVFNSSKYYFCIQHGYQYGGHYNKREVDETNYHEANIATAGKASGQVSDPKGDIPDSKPDFYVAAKDTLTKPSSIDYVSYKEDGEAPLEYAYTNWLYTPEDIAFDCEDGGAELGSQEERAKLAFLFACYLSDGPNNQYVRGKYQADPMQHAVWASFLNTGNKEANPLKTQEDAYWSYHEKSDNPGVDTIPDPHVGTTISGSVYSTGPFKMEDFVEAKDFISPKVSSKVDEAGNNDILDNEDIDLDFVDAETVIAGTVESSEQTLQDVFGTETDRLGTIIKAEAVVSNGATTKRVEFDIPEGGSNYYIKLNESEIQGYDEIEDIIFTYQRIHVCAEGTKYIGTQYRLQFSQKSETDSSCTYDCTEHTPSYASHETGAPEGGSQTCTYTWDCDDHDEGCGCAGGHTRSGCSCGGHTTNPDGSQGSPICDGHRKSGCNCACDGHSDTHTSIFKCEHDHEKCKEFQWQFDGEAGDVAQDGYAGSGELVNEIIEYKIKVEVPLKTDMTIYKYITDVEHAEEGGTDIAVEDRSGMTYESKAANTVKVERGDIITYNVTIKNESRFPTSVKVKDTLPTPIFYEDGDYELIIPSDFQYRLATGTDQEATRITVAANSQVDYTIKLKNNADSGTYENKVEFITTNAGPEYMQYTKWGDNATHGPHTNGNIVNIATDHQFDGDFYTIKEYDVTVDKYIRVVNHKTNGELTFDKTDRMKVLDESAKSGNPVYAEFGDVVTYYIDIYNTCEEFMTAEKQVRSEEPYWNPDIAYVNIEDTLPKKYSELTVEVSNGTGSKTATAAESDNGGTLKITDILVPAGEKVQVIVTLVVEEVAKDTLEENKAVIDGDVLNVNKLAVKNHSTKTETSDWYKIQDYNLSINKFVSNFKSARTNENNSLGFTNETNMIYGKESGEQNAKSKRSEMSNEVKKTKPVHVEKTDIITYTIIAKNDAVAASELKYATQVRPTGIRDRLDDGLLFKEVAIKLVGVNGNTRIENVPYTIDESEGNNTYVFNIAEKLDGEYLILEPGEYMEYTVTVEVTKSNMYLFDLSNEASIKTLTNINSDINTKVRVVTEQNITPSPNSFEYVKLKDLVIAGRVWLDTDEDGLMKLDENGKFGGTLKMSDKPSIYNDESIEYAMEGIKVILYRKLGENVTVAAVTRTDSDGMFTFARNESLEYYEEGEYSYYSEPEKEYESAQRIDKAVKDENKDYYYLEQYSEEQLKDYYYEYYIEYEYDGLVYRSTEVYSYKDNINDNGSLKSDKYKIDSNATEFDDVRKEFNEHYAIMSYNQAADYSNIAETSVLEFEKIGHESFIRENPERVMTSRSFIFKPEGETEQKTDYLWLYDFDIGTTSEPETEYLKYINLGLEERDKLDLRLQKDLIDAKVEINGFELDYEYGTIPTETLYYKRQGDDVANENEELYNLYLYNSDYFYRYEMYSNDDVRKAKGKGSELQVDLHYRITVFNESIKSEKINNRDEFARIYEIVDYNTSSMEIKSVVINGSNTTAKFYPFDPANPKNIGYVSSLDENASPYNVEEKYAFAGPERTIWELGSIDADTGKETIIETTVGTANYETNFIHGMEDYVIGTGEKLTIDVVYTIDKFNPDNDYPADLKARSLYVDDKFNVAQIGAYAAFEERTGETPKALVDNDSNAANINNECVCIEAIREDDDDICTICREEHKELYEDNAFRVGLNIDEKEDERTVEGLVFEDARSEKIDTLNSKELNHFTGNGMYNSSDVRDGEIKTMKEQAGMQIDDKQDLENDTLLEGMTVQLVEIIALDKDVNGNGIIEENEKGISLYEEIIDPLDFEARGNVIVQTRSDEVGKYTIDSFIPGTYVVRFRYGDIFVNGTNKSMTENSLLHNGQDYKSTSYVLTEEAVNSSMPSVSSLFGLMGSATSTTLVKDSTDNDIKYKALSLENYSDARDNELRRVEIMAESEVMNNNVAEFMKYFKYNNAVINENLEKFANATNGFADTVTVTLAIEEKEKTKNQEGKSVELDKNEKALTLDLPNVDYGVVFRPENFIEMTKKIKNIKLTTMDGEVLVDLEYDIEGNLTREIGKHNVQAVNTIDRTQGFRYINVDEDLIQGASLAIEYFMIVNNIGEVDTVNQRLIDEKGSEAILAKLNAKRAVIKSAIVTPSGNPIGTQDNYIRISDLIDAVYDNIPTEDVTYDYGFFVGNIYYEGKDARDTTDVRIVPLKVSKILDFIDNDASFVQANNSVKNKFWTMTKEEELLRDGLIGEGGLKTITTGIESTLVYLDDEARQYVTKEKLNLVYNVGTEIDNPSLVRNIIPVYAKQGNDEAFIVIQLDDVLGGDDESESMVYDNVAEIIEFITPVGRRTNFASTVGNIELNGTKKPFEAALEEVDSDGTEVVRLTPPTGRDKLNLMMSGSKYIIIGTITLVMAVVIVYITAYSLKGKVGKSKFYK